MDYFICLNYSIQNWFPKPLSKLLGWEDVGGTWLELNTYRCKHRLLFPIWLIIAQLVEHGANNAKVQRSIPGWSVIFFTDCHLYCVVVQFKKSIPQYDFPTCLSHLSVWTFFILSDLRPGKIKSIYLKKKTVLWRISENEDAQFILFYFFA